MSINAKELLFEETAREKLQGGIEKLVQAASPTLGPQGRNVGLEASFGSPLITSDGYTIVKEIEFKDQYLNMGASMGKEVAAKMKELCGDGTTTSLILLNALVQQGVKNIAAGASPIDIKRGIDKTVAAITQHLLTSSIKLTTDAEIENIATASASGHNEIGKIIAQAIKQAGPQGVITIEESKTTATQVKTIEGMELSRGTLSPYFCTDPTTQTTLLERPRILLTDKKISSIQEILPLLQTLAATGEELLIIADDLEGDALSTLVVNKLRGTLKVAAIKAPGFGDNRKELMKDIAALTGATPISEEMGMLLKETTPSELGHAEKVFISKEKTLLTCGPHNRKAVEERVHLITSEIKSAKNSYDKEKLEARQAALTGGIAVISVGAVTETELKARKHLFEDSLNATRAALEEGVVAGGGVALFRAAKGLAALDLQGDEKTGEQIVMKALEAPLRQLLLNSGHNSSLLLEEILSKPATFGFNVESETVEDLVQAGILDPVKVVRSALTLAASVAGTLLLSEVLIGNAPESAEE